MVTTECFHTGTAARRRRRRRRAPSEHDEKNHARGPDVSRGALVRAAREHLGRHVHERAALCAQQHKLVARGDGRHSKVGDLELERVILRRRRTRESVKM
jgi:hypothetical protein